MSYSSILDLRDEYRSGQVLEAVIKEFDPEAEKLEVSVKEVNPNPFDGADTRHPVGSDRQAIVTNRYRGGVFCRLADTTTCMCLFGRSYTEYDCNPGDRVIVHILSLIHIFYDPDNKGWKAIPNAIKGVLVDDDDQYSLEIALLSRRSAVTACHIYILDADEADAFFSWRCGDFGVYP